MKKVLKQLSWDIYEIHAPNFDCDIDGCSDDPTAADQSAPTKPDATLNLTSRAISINCHLKSPIDHHLSIYSRLHWNIH